MRTQNCPRLEFFVPLFDDQQHMYTNEAPEPPSRDEREYDDDRGGWLSRPSER